MFTALKQALLKSIRRASNGSQILVCIEVYCFILTSLFARPGTAVKVQQVEEEIDDVDLCRNLAVLLLLLVTFWMIKIQDDQRNVRHQDS